MKAWFVWLIGGGRRRTVTVCVAVEGWMKDLNDPEGGPAASEGPEGVALPRLEGGPNGGGKAASL